MKYSLLSILSLVIFLNGCVTSGFNNFYTSFVDSNTIPKEYKLQEGEDPKVYFSKNLDEDILEMESQHYVRIGYSYFNGPEASDSEVMNAAKNLAKNKGAKIALYNYYYTDTRSGSLTLPSIQTSQQSGNIFSGGNSAYYRGTTKTYGTSTTNYSIRRYDFVAILFVPMSENSTSIKLGFYCVPLTNEIRKNVGTNTGVYIPVVYKNTPAYYANLMIGDVIININGYDILDMNSMEQILRSMQPGDKMTISVIRNGEKKIIEYNMKNW
jgi:hypothetical protein